MSPAHRAHRARPSADGAPLFAALGDKTRLALLTRIAATPRLSIARLTEGSSLTRQAITKHLRVLQEGGLVRGVRHGRENRFELEPASLDRARSALDELSRQWDDALARLRSFVESKE